MYKLGTNISENFKIKILFQIQLMIFKLQMKYEYIIK